MASVNSNILEENRQEVNNVRQLKFEPSWHACMIHQMLHKWTSKNVSNASSICGYKLHEPEVQMPVCKSYIRMDGAPAKPRSSGAIESWEGR